MDPPRGKIAVVLAQAVPKRTGARYEAYLRLVWSLFGTSPIPERKRHAIAGSKLSPVCGSLSRDFYNALSPSPRLVNSTVAKTHCQIGESWKSKSHFACREYLHNHLGHAIHNLTPAAKTSHERNSNFAHHIHNHGQRQPQTASRQRERGWRQQVQRQCCRIPGMIFSPLFASLRTHTCLGRLHAQEQRQGGA
jgi:hypothetical protein